MPDKCETRTVTVRSLKDLFTLIALAATGRGRELKEFVSSIEAKNRKCSAPKEDVVICNTRSPRMIQ